MTMRDCREFSARTKWIVPLFLLLSLVIASRSSAAPAAKQASTPVAADGSFGASCPLGPFDVVSMRNPQPAIWHRLSNTTEAVAPSTPVTTAAGSERRRSFEPPHAIQFPPLAIANFIDADVGAAQQKAGISPTTISSDEEFLRRVTIDLTGQIPDPATLQSFLGTTSPTKRAAMIDQLLNSDAFVDRWTMWFGDLVQNVQVSANSREYYEGRNAYYNYIHDSIKNGKPYDQMAREVIANKGDSFVDGQTNFWVRQIQPNGPIQDTYDNLSAESADRFIGMPFLCLSCHNGVGHLELVNQYLKTRTRYDFWANAAFFATTKATGVAVGSDRKFMIDDNLVGRYMLNTTSGNKTPRQPATGQPNFVDPAFLLTGEKPRPGEMLRDAYARIVTANPQFARAAVNYLWKEMFGLGIVEPANAFDPARQDPNNLPPGQTLQPTNAALLNDLQNEFIASGYNLRSILKTIATSNTYQLSTKYAPGNWNESWTPYYARHYAHRLMSEEMLDAIVKATGVGVTFNVQGIGVVGLAMKLPDTIEARNTANGRFLDEFGRGDRDTAARTNDTSVAQALSLMNDTIVTNRVHRATAGSTVAKVLASTTDPVAIADQLYVATLSRHPTQSESAQAVAFIRAGNLQQRTEDLQWVLINSLEFLFD
ncbi:MAG TPA: DUF1549 domain-containing protein [Thermoanaerobaculia bacterium]|nr:DUF1549 domain-containing protein [Thermoanaerobaculia bacterium]